MRPPSITEYLKQLTQDAQTVVTPAELRSYANTLKDRGASDYSSFVGGIEAIVLKEGVFISEAQAASFVGVSPSTLYRRKLNGLFPRSDRVSQGRVAYNRFRVAAYALGLLAKNELEWVKL